MDTRKQQLRKVRPEDFDADALLRAAREGRLFIAPAAERHPITEVLDYVERIREYATNPHVREIWEAILSHEQLAPLFYLDRYASKRGQINWYYVTAIVIILHSNGVYRKDVSDTQLHLCLEQTSKRNGRYTGSNKYSPAKEEILIVRQIVKNFSL